MGFSATGSLLTGSLQRPDTVMFIENKENRSSTVSSTCKLNISGYIPVVSTITGLGRALLGVVHTIVHLVSAIFSQNREHHLQEASLGAKNIGRGFVEAIPVIGNITLFVVDLRRTNRFEDMAWEKIEKNSAAYDNHITMFIYGQEIAKRPVAEVTDELEKLNRKPSLTDLINIIQNKK